MRLPRLTRRARRLATMERDMERIEIALMARGPYGIGRTPLFGPMSLNDFRLAVKYGGYLNGEPVFEDFASGLSFMARERKD